MKPTTGSVIGMFAICSAALFAILVRLAFIGVVVWTAVHFIRKWW